MTNLEVATLQVSWFCKASLNTNDQVTIKNTGYLSSFGKESTPD